MKKCRYDKDGICWALACYGTKKCGARDAKGHPVYATDKPRKRYIEKNR